MKRRQREPSEIPTSSMADIAFLLIIFFMLTAVFTSTRGLQFALPKDDPTQLDIQPEEAIHIKIMGEEQILVDKAPMTLESSTTNPSTRAPTRTVAPRSSARRA